MWVKVLGNVAAIIVQREAKEVLSHVTESQSSLPAKVLPRALVYLLPSCPNL